MTGVLHYSSAAAPTTLSSPLSLVTPGSTGSVVVASVTGMPIAFPFTLIADWGTANAEVITVTQAATGTGPFTFANCVRGDDGTAAPSHLVGAAISHGVSARDFYKAGSDWVNVLSADYGADPSGTADSTTAIQAAITVASATGGTVYLPAGTYKTSAALQVPQGASPGTAIIGAGMGSTTIKPVTGATFNVLQTQLAPTSIATGYTYTRVRFRDITLDCSLMTGTVAGHGNGLYLFGGIECIIERIDVQSCPNWGIVLDATAANDAFWSWVRDCIVNNSAGGILAGYNTACTITGCVIPNFKNAAAATQPVYTGPLTTVTNALFSGSEATRVINNVFGSGTGTTNEVVLTTNIENTLVGNYFPSNASSGTTLHNAANTNTVTGNVFESPVGGSAGPAIIPGTDDVYTGNIFKNAGAAMTYAISNNVAGVVISGNQLVAGTSGVVNNQGNAWRVSGSQGYNPVGKIAAPPGVAGSGSPVTNTTGVDCMVIVTCNATPNATSISIGGNATGITSVLASAVLSPVRVPSGQTITLTYTNAPTWTWWGD